MTPTTLLGPLALVDATRRWTLRPGVSAWIGRHPSCHVVVDDPRVSRFHAQIGWSGGQPEVRDANSTNGTRLDGQPLGSAPVVLEIGGVLEVGEWRAELAVEEVEEVAPALVEEDDEHVTWLPEQVQLERGDFEGCKALHRLLLLWEGEERTGTLWVRGEWEVRATLGGGQVVAARCGRLRGLDAVERLTRLASGTYLLSREVEVEVAECSVSVRRLLREGYWATKRLEKRALSAPRRQ